MPLIFKRLIVKNPLFSTIKYLLFSPTFLSFFRRRFWGITIRSITQEVEGVALESLHPAGHLVRRKSHDDGLYRVSRTQLFIVILHRNLAFFQATCGAMQEYIGRRIEAVITGLTRNQLNSKEFRGFESHRLRQVSLLNSTLGSDFLLPFCKTPLLFL